MDCLVADHRFRILIPDDFALGLDNYAPFAVEAEGEPLFTLELAPEPAPEPPHAELVIDQGAEPDYTISNPAFLYDRAGLTEYINSLH